MTKKQKTLSFINLGCFKNIVDTEVLGGLLRENNIKIVSSYEDSDWLVINTCGFIQEAKEESIDEILRTLERKEKGEIKLYSILFKKIIKALVKGKNAYTKEIPEFVFSTHKQKIPIFFYFSSFFCCLLAIYG